VYGSYKEAASAPRSIGSIAGAAGVDGVVGTGVDGVEVLGAGVAIEEPRLRDRGQQPLTVVLAVDLDELAGQLRERRDRRELSAHTRGAPSLGGDRPREQDLAVLGPARAHRCRRRVEPRLHLRRRRAHSNERRTPAPAEREL
jgi:hypothetical protein